MRLTVARRNEMLTALIDNFNSGKIRGYSGTRPTNADTALSGNTLLFECTLNATSFPAPSGGVLTANAITSDASADASGTLSFIRVFESDGTTAVGDFSVGTSGAEFNFPTLTVTAAVAVSISSMTITMPVGT